MPHQPPSSTQTRLNNIITGFTGVINTLEVLAEAFKAPFLDPIAKTARSLLTVVQNVKHNKSDCINLIEQITNLLYAVISTHLKSTTGLDLPPSTLNHIGKFMETLHKIHAYTEAQQEKTRIRNFFRQGDLTALLKACNIGLKEARDVFKLENVTLLANVAYLQKYAKDKHQEVLQMIEALSEETISDRGSVRMLSAFGNSSTSISMLPSEPKVFYGRETELSYVLKLFVDKTPRVAILGPGGIGKTSLAKIVLHHPQITTKFDQRRFFVACDATSTLDELAALIVVHMGLNPTKNSTKSILNFLSSNPACLLILDNLETLWDPKETKKDVEELLSLLTDCENLALLITMRGAERPGKVQWTRPFLPQLKPLSEKAAHQIFVAIADDTHDPNEIHNVLALTGNMPLAIDLIAHLVDSENCSTVLSRWEIQKTSLISQGFDKQSNLNISISLSLNSSQMRSTPQTRDLLSLLSMLPDGISDAELVQSKLPIANILSHKSTLLSTSLAYTDEKKRLKTLVPIQEYMQKFHPPEAPVVQHLLEHFQELLQFYDSCRGTLSSSEASVRISSNFGNIKNLLENGLHTNNPKLVDTIYCICHLETFSFMSQQGHIPLVDKNRKLLPELHNPGLEVYVISEILSSWTQHAISNPELLINQALVHLPHFDDPDTKSRFYHIAGNYVLTCNDDITTALKYYATAFSLAISNGNAKRQSAILVNLAEVKWRQGDYIAGQRHAYEAQRLARISGDLWREASALDIEATCSYGLGNYNDALASCRRGRDLLSLCGMSGGEADHTIMATHAEVHRLKSEFEEAYDIRQKMLAEEHPEDVPQLHGMSLLTIGQTTVQMGIPKEVVQRHINGAKPLFSALGYTSMLVCCDMVTADLNLREGNILKANMIFQQCLTFASGKNSEIVTYCLEGLANRSRWSLPDQARWSLSWPTLYLAFSLQKKQRLDIHKSLQFLGDIFLAHNDQKTATSLFTVALEGFAYMDIHCSRAECMLCLGDIAQHRGNYSKAVELWRTAKPLFERSSQATQVAAIDERLTIISKNILETHTQSMAHISKINAPAGASTEELIEGDTTDLAPETLVQG